MANKTKKTTTKPTTNSQLTEEEIIDKHRNQVLSKGRKFKYPLQYAKHRVVIITIILASILLVVLTVGMWFALYKVQNTSNVLYRITQAIPVPVAQVDNTSARYSDYLLIYRSSLHTVEQQSGQLGNDDDANQVREQYKRSALNNAEDYAYAMKLGEEMNITVSNDEIKEAFDAHRKVGGVERSEESFLKIIEDNFGLDRSEYERMLYMSLMKSKVMQAIDTEAQSLATQIEQKLSTNGGDLMMVAAELGDAVQYEETGDLVDSKNVDGGRATKALTLTDGALSERFLSENGDGYYYVKLKSKTDTKVNYVSLKIPFKTFDKKMSELREQGKVSEYIEVAQ